MQNKPPDLTVSKKDFDIQWFSGTGAGGQHRNKHQNCCRLVHRASGVTTTGQGSRSRKQNLSSALHQLAADKRFRAWCLATVNGIEERVEEMMRPENIKVKYYTPSERKHEE
jgi:protein subunit release factor A